MNSTWIKTKSDESAFDAGCTFDLPAAERVRRFFERYLRHSKGQFAGKPFELLPWQWGDVIAPLYGWRMPDGTRRFRSADVFVPKKNGKSTLFAGLSLYHCCADNEAGAEVYSAAGDRRQACIIYEEATAMIDASPALSNIFVKRPSVKKIKHPKSNSFYEALSSDAPTKEGLNISCLLFDELHTQPNKVLWDTLKYGGAARRQPLKLAISTAGIWDDTSLWVEHWQKCKRILSGEEVDISFLAVLYAADADDDWTQEATWKKANPSYGITLSARDFEEECKSAQRNAAEESAFKRYRLNVPVSASSGWIQPIYWHACALDEPREKDGLTIAGLDLASTTDLTAYVEATKLPDCLYLTPHFWCPELRVKEREKSNKQRFSQWVDEGYIKQTPTTYTDYDVIHSDILALCMATQPKEIAVDSWNFTQLAVNLQTSFKARRVKTKIVPVRSGFQSISAATKELERLILSGRVRFQRNPVLDWMFANTAIEQDASGNKKPAKQRSADKIDGIVAAILALARFLVMEEKPASKYETQRLTFVNI